MKRGLQSVLVLLLLVGSCLAPASRGAESTEREYAIKAAFLYKFLRYVQWPEEKASDQPYVIGILGNDPFGQALQPLQNKTINGRRVRIEHLQDLSGDHRCHVIFISSSEFQRLAELLRPLNASAVLTVADSPQFAERGGMINLVAEKNRVRLQINPKAATEAGLSISSQLLKIAQLVES